MTYHAILVAGGSGSRMNSDLPKQFLELHQKPILQHTIEKFLIAARSLPSLHLYVVLPETQILFWQNLCQKYHFVSPQTTLVVGGQTRFQSVKNGLAYITAEEGFVAVHDGVRPYVLPEIILKSFEIAKQTGSAITSVPLKESIRHLLPNGQSRAVDRTSYRMIQTPQTFRLDWLRSAFQSEEKSFYTDCASVLEHMGYPITLIEGQYDNIKITTPEDLR